MAKIPQYEQRTQTPMGPGPALLRPDEVYYDGSALKGIGTTVNNIAHIKEANDEEHARAWSATAVSGARLHWTQQFHDRSANAEPGAPDFSPKFVKDYDDYSNELLGTAPTKKAKAFLQSRLAELRGQLGDRVMEFEAKARVDWRTDQFSAGIDNVAKLMNTDPGQYKTALAEQIALIDSSALPPLQRSAMREKAVNQVSKSAVWSQIQRYPDGFLNSIGFGPTDKEGKVRSSSGGLQGITGNSAFDALPVKERTEMFEQAIRLKNQLGADVERLAVAERKRLGEEAEKSVWEAYGNKKLTRAIIEKHRPLLSGSEYGSFLKLLEKPDTPVKSDPGTFREFQRLIYDDPAAAARYGFEKHRQGLLGNSDFESGLGRARTLDRQEGPKSEFERSMKYIVGSLDPGPFVPDPVGKQRLAEAINSFERWHMAEKRTDQEVAVRAQEIVGQYKMVNFGDTVMALPIPRVGGITRQTGDRNKLAKEVQAAGVEIQRRRDSGMYKPGDYEQEMAILNRWRKVSEGIK